MLIVKYIKGNSKGSALIYVLLVFVILAVLGTVVLNVSVAENKFSVLDANMLRAYYIARSGAEAYAKSVESNPSLPSPPANAIDFGEGDFKIISVDTANKLVTVTGTYGNAKKTVKLRLKYRGVFGSAVFAINNLNMHNNSSLTGNASLAVGATATGDLTNIHGSIIPDCPNPYTDISFVAPHTNPFDDSLGLTSFTGGGTLPATPTAYESIDLGSSNTLEVNTTYGVVTEIDAQEFKANNSILRVKGGGTLIIHVHSLDFMGTVRTDPDTATVFVLAPNPQNGVVGNVNLQTGSSEFQAFIYGPSANVTIRASMIMLGGIIANNVSIESNASLSFPSTLPNGLPPYLAPATLGLTPFGYEKDKWED